MGVAVAVETGLIVAEVDVGVASPCVGVGGVVRSKVAGGAAIVGVADGWTVGKGVEVAVPPQAKTMAIIASHQNDFMR